MRSSGRVVAAVVAAVAVAAAGCAKSADVRDAAAGGRVRVAAGLYPLAYVARLVAGPDADVADLTPPGAEPHEVELRPSDVAALERADLVLLVRGLQPAVDAAAPRERVLDALAAGAPPRRDASGATDPHVWLDPTRLAVLARDVAERLGGADPAHADAYRARGQQAHDRLRALDADLAAGLRTCARRDVVTSHAAFGYLADRYDLTEVGISGLSPEAEPPPGRIAEVTRYVRDKGVTTVFFETLVSPRVARTIARETGAKTAVLDPVESVEPGDDYDAAMRRNLAALRTALGCT